MKSVSSMLLFAGSLNERHAQCKSGMSVNISFSFVMYEDCFTVTVIPPLVVDTSVLKKVGK